MGDVSTDKSSNGADAFLGAVVAAVGTTNLWKIDSITSRLPVDLTVAALGLALAAVMVTWLSNGLRVERSWVPLLVGFALFVPAMAVTDLANPYSTNKASSLFTICLLAAVAPMMLLTTPRRRGWFLVSLAVLGAAISMLLLSGAAPAGQVSDALSRAQIGEANPIALGRMGSIGVVVFGLLALQRRARARLVMVAGLAVCGSAAAATGSRGPLLAAAAAVVAVALSSSGRSRVKTLVLLAVASIGTYEVVQQVVAPQALQRLSDAYGGQSDQFRVRVVQESLSLSWDNWAGVGWGDLGNYLTSAARSDVQGWVQYPHNLLVEVLVEGGVLGLIGLLVMLFASGRRLWWNRGDGIGRVLLGLWIFAVLAAMSSGDVIGNRIVWMMIGVGLAYPLRPATVTEAAEEKSEVPPALTSPAKSRRYSQSP